MNYSIGEFSKLTNLSIDTLRYYEKEGLITPERKKMVDVIIVKKM